MPHDHDAPTAEPSEFWEERYASSGRVWSGKVNHALVQAVSTLAPGRALDLGCGEGGDVLWLAAQGWDATGVDISATATRRGAEAAAEAGLADRVHLVAADLSTWTSDQTYDLVTASFLQSPVELPRADILRRAAQWVAPGGHLLVIAHAAMPPWAKAAGHHSHDFISPSDEVAALGLEGWTTEIAEVRTREATGPDGQQAMLDDTVVLLRR
jgi:cyclopropane fatty-acyl-phospholipid synthase-like methyltransferase